MSNESTLLLGEARVKGKVILNHNPPKKVELLAGDTLRVRMTYRVYDETTPEELWTFRLATRIDDDDDSISERIHRDRKLLSDDILSHVGVDLDFPKPGEYKLSYEMFAQLAHRQWDERTSFEPVSADNVDGELTIHVLKEY